MEQQDNDRQETDNSRLARAKRKLECLKREYSAQISRVFDHQAQTNGQPMNDKANGRSFFNRQEQLEDKARTLLREIEAQEGRISTLEYQKERKALGLNKQGGLIMSVDNIPMIKTEIEQAKQRRTIMKKIFTGLFILLFSFALAGCSQSIQDELQENNWNVVSTNGEAYTASFSESTVTFNSNLFQRGFNYSIDEEEDNITLNEPDTDDEPITFSINKNESEFTFTAILEEVKETFGDLTLSPIVTNK